VCGDHGGGNMEARFVRCWRTWRGSCGAGVVAMVEVQFRGKAWFGGGYLGGFSVGFGGFPERPNGTRR